MFTIVTADRQGITEQTAEFRDAAEHIARGEAIRIAFLYASALHPVTIGEMTGSAITVTGPTGVRIATVWITGECSPLVYRANRCLADIRENYSRGESFDRATFETLFGADAVENLIARGSLVADPLAVWLRTFPALLALAGDESDNEGPGGYVTDYARF